MSDNIKQDIQEVITRQTEVLKLMEKIAAQVAWCAKEIYELKAGKEWDKEK